jgi:Zn finger protein HypA/HybF involved in hydrogenase expression
MCKFKCNNCGLEFDNFSEFDLEELELGGGCWDCESEDYEIDNGWE